MTEANSSTILQAQNQIMNASKEELYRLVNYLYFLQGDRFATGNEYQTMLNDASHARETVYQMAQHGDASVIHAFLSGQNVDTHIYRGGLDFENPEVLGEPEDEEQFCGACPARLANYDQLVRHVEVAHPLPSGPKSPGEERRRLAAQRKARREGAK